jgi:hypothetical protein
MLGVNGVEVQDTGASQLSCYSSLNEGAHTSWDDGVFHAEAEHNGMGFWASPSFGEVCVRAGSQVTLVMSPILVGSSPSWRTDLPSRFRSSHGRCGIVLHAVYQ